MNQLPDFWRTEVFHPLSVHFPIAILLVAFLFKLIALGSAKDLWKQGGTFLLLLGTIGVWIAIYTQYKYTLHTGKGNTYYINHLRLY